MAEAKPGTADDGQMRMEKKYLSLRFCLGTVYTYIDIYMQTHIYINTLFPFIFVFFTF